MSRSELNAPSIRMGRVLDDFDALEAAYEEVCTLLAEVSPDTFMKASPKPSRDAIINEKARRQYTLGKVQYTREQMRLLRSREGTTATPRVSRRAELSRAVIDPSTLPELSLETQAEILAEAERLAEPPANPFKKD